MGEYPYDRSTDATTFGRHRVSWRGAKILFATLSAAALFAAALTTTTAPRAEARERIPDTIAVVDGFGHFTVLAELADDAATRRYTFGAPGDVPMMGDWDCDGDDTPGVYRLSSGAVYLRNSHTTGIADRSYYFGNPGDRAFAGDFDGDKCDTVSVYRSHRATAYLKNSIASGAAELSFMFGNPGDRSFAGDFNGDGVDTVGLRRDSSAMVYLAGKDRSVAAVTLAFGNPGDQIIAGDWDGDGVDTVAAYRPSTGVFYYRNSNSTGAGTGQVRLGRGLTVLPVAGIRASSVDGPSYDPGEPEPTSPTPSVVTPPPSSTTPAPATGEPVSVPGFATPPARPVSGPIQIDGDSNVVIENVHVSNPGGVCIDITNASNVTIRNSTIGPCGDEAIYLSDVDGATISGNYISGTGNGVLVHRSDSVKVDSNAFVDAGRNFVQFDKVNGAGSSVSGNRGQNELGGTNAEDLVSIYSSSGTSSSPIRVSNNHLRNGGPSDSGSGIMLGDGGGSHVVVEGNVLVNPGQVGIGVASGEHITVRSNIIYSEALPWSNTGMYVWNQYDSACNDIEVSGNRVNWTAAGGYDNAWWSGGGCSNLTVSGNDWNASVGPGNF